MTFNVSPVQQPIRDMMRAFGPKIEPLGREWDRKPDGFAHDMYKLIAGQGLCGYVMPKEYGGGGHTALEYATMIEELAYIDPPSSLLAAVGQLACDPIIKQGTDEQKKKYIPDAAVGKTIPAFALTEPNAGSDAANQSTTATIDGDHYVINGEKIFIMHGDVCSFAVTFCKIMDGDSGKVSAIIVPGDAPGLRKECLQFKMGMKYATTGRLWYTNVRVPRSNLLGEVGKGFRYAMGTLDGARIGIAAQSTGLAQRALDEAVKYAKQRIAFGAPIAKLQAIQWMIADMSTKTEAARLLTYKAAELQDKGEKFGMEAAQAKLFASEAANFCVQKTMQIHGGYGYIGEFSIIEKLYRDQRVCEIYEGTSEVQRLVIAGNLLRG
ncbi:MAG: acyl-CoA dehydrogenase family protein [bacterium]|nr:acyl-CoA dehydrogenase family protein [bacterium]